MLDSGLGRQRSTPGYGEKVAAGSLMTVAFKRFASRARGSAWRTSARQRSMISWRGFCKRSYVALMTNWRYWEFFRAGSAGALADFVPFEPAYSADLLKIHCVVVSSRVTKGSDMTCRS